MIIALICMAIGILVLIAGTVALKIKLDKEEHRHRDKETENALEIEKYKQKVTDAEKNLIRSDGCENRIIELNHRIEEKQDRIKKIDEEIEAKTGILTYVTLE